MIEKVKILAAEHGMETLVTGECQDLEKDDGEVGCLTCCSSACSLIEYFYLLGVEGVQGEF